MLQHIHIENMAVIEEADIDFASGLTVLTGETGAGKSIVIDALNMVLGERSSRDLVRTGCNKAEVTALFTSVASAVESLLTEMGYDTDEGQVLIRRKITADGKSSCYVNGSPITVAMLRSVGRLLVNIHGQHDNQALLSEDKQREYLDTIGGLHPLLETYLEAYRRYGTIVRRLKQLRADEQDKEARIDSLHFRLQEIDQFGPRVGEEQELFECRTRMRHAEKMSFSIQKAVWSLEGDAESIGVLAGLQQATEAIEQMAEVLPSMQGLVDKLQSIRYELDEISSEVSREQDALRFDEDEKEQIETRWSELRRLLSKYGPTEADMIAFADSARQELSELENRDQSIAENERLLALAEEDTVNAAAVLTQARRATADRFASDVMEQLQFLDMKGTRLTIAMEPTTLTASGGDKLTFLLAANAGEEPKPLTRSASGGELSRIMLAIKSVMAGADDIDTLVFDEIDTGISGHAARRVGVKLRETAVSRQVLCVTHLAQIAAAADRQLVVRKEVVGERTRTRVDTVEGAAREEELSRIISGEITPAGVAAARDLLARVASNENT